MTHVNTKLIVISEGCTDMCELRAHGIRQKSSDFVCSVPGALPIKDFTFFAEVRRNLFPVPQHAACTERLGSNSTPL